MKFTVANNLLSDDSSLTLNSNSAVYRVNSAGFKGGGPGPGLSKAGGLPPKPSFFC